MKNTTEVRGQPFTYDGSGVPQRGMQVGDLSKPSNGDYWQATQVEVGFLGSLAGSRPRLGLGEANFMVHYMLPLPLFW